MSLRSIRATCRFEKNSAHGLRLDAIPPRTDAGRELMIAFHHLHRPAESLFRKLEAQLPSIRALLGREPGALVPPHARPLFAFRRLPGRGVDHAPAPPVLDHESGRRPAVERGQEVTGMAPERDRQAPL